MGQETDKFYAAFLLKNGVSDYLSRKDAKELQPLAKKSYEDLLDELPGAIEKEKDRIIKKLDFSRDVIDKAEGKDIKDYQK